MLTPSLPSTDVIIAGAGPTGLMLACELLLAGCSVRVLEKAAQPHSPLKTAPFGRRGLSVPTIENLDRRGLLDDLLLRMPTGDAEETMPRRRPGGHFAGIDFFPQRIESAVPENRPPVTIDTLAADMASIETVLTRRAETLGVDIRRGVSVEGLDESVDGVVVRAGGECFRSRWLVGCDGGRSAVRKLAGIGFGGTEPEFTGYSLDVTLAEPDLLEPGRNLTPGGVYIYAPPGRLWVAVFDAGACHRAEAITREHVEAVLSKVCGRDIVVEALHLASTWTDRAYLASEYRKGRVLLAGDAAHVHSPLGGQGLNLGLGDAMNLGWKLASLIRGDASMDLVDSYETERRPIAEQVLDRSRAQVALLRPNAGSRALEAIMRDLIDTRDGTSYFAERIQGTGIRYALDGAHPLVGRSAPDVVLEDGRRLNECLRNGCGLLINFEGRAALRNTAARFRGRIAYVMSAPVNTLGLGALLVRPDGIVVWAASAGADGDDLGHVLSRWFGDATGMTDARPLTVRTPYHLEKSSC